MGILAPDDSMSGIDPRTQGMMAAGFAMLNASGPSRTPVSLGQIIGQGGNAGLSAYNGALGQLRQLSQTQALIDLEKGKLDMLKIQTEAAKRQDELKRNVLESWIARQRAQQGGGMLAPPGQSVVLTGEGNAAAPPAPDWLPQRPQQQPGMLAPQQQGGGAGGFRMSAEDAAMLKLGGVGDFSEIMKHLNTPQNMPAGGYSRDPATGQERFMNDPYKDPAYLQRIAQNESQARQQAESQYRQPIKLDIPGIGPVMLSGPAALEYANSGRLPGGGAQPPPQPQPGPAAPSVDQAAAGFRTIAMQEAAPAAAPRPLRPGAVQSEADAAADKARAEGLVKRELDRPKAAASLREYLATLDRVNKSAKELKAHPGLPGITGIYGRAPTVYGSSVAAEAQLKTLQAQAAFKELQEMRRSSPTGGALGSVSERELDLLTNAVAALDRKQGTKAFQGELDKIMNSIHSAKVRMHRAFSDEYGKDAAKEFSISAEDILKGM